MKFSVGKWIGKTHIQVNFLPFIQMVKAYPAVQKTSAPTGRASG
jgi:hypothetical protein